MKNLRLNLTLFVTLLIIGAALRLWLLGNDGHPLLWDEAALGYNAYSIAKTGADEYGVKFPLVLKSFGDYKPGLYSYAAIPSIIKFGLSEFSVRLPSAIAGIAIIILIYLITEELFPGVGLFSSFVATLNPWLVHFSRAAWEANLCLMFTLFGIWLFLQARKKPKLLVLSAISFGLTLLTYQSAKLTSPLIIFCLVALWGKPLLVKSTKLFLLSTFVLIGIVLPIILSAASSSGRLTVMSTFSYPRPEADSQKIALEEGISQNSFQFKLLHGQWLASLNGVLERYFNHFSGRFLFYEGDWDNGRLGSPYVGQFYWLDGLFLVIGFVFLIKFREKKSAVFLFCWIIISPLPAALSRDIVQSVRALNLSVPISILAGVGAYRLLLAMVRLPKILYIGTFSVLLVAYFWNVYYYLDSYFVHAPVLQSKDWLYGYKETVKRVSEINQSAQQVIFTQKFGQPYIYSLFYAKVDPKAYQSQAVLTENPNGDVGYVEKFANFRFRNIYWPEDRKLGKTFFVGTEEELPTRDIDPKQSKIIQDIVRPDGSIAFRIVETY